MPVYKIVTSCFQLRPAMMGNTLQGWDSSDCVSGTWVAAVSRKLMLAIVVRLVAMRGRLEPSGRLLAYDSVRNIYRDRRRL